MPAIITHPAEALCPRCGEVVLRIGHVILTRHPVVGGLFNLAGDPDRLRPKRRRLRECADEYAARRAIHGGGHDPHACPDDEAAWCTR